MNTILQSQIFFFISSLGFIILFILGAVILVYLIRVMRTFSKIIEKADKDIDAFRQAINDLLEGILNNPLFRLFSKSKKRTSHTKKP